MALNPLPLSDPSPVQVIPAGEATSFLAELGISVSGIQNALLDAMDAASLRDNPYWANTARGIELWSNLVHGVRRLLHEDNEWTVDNPQNRPVMVRDDGRYEFALAGGDSGTGNPEIQPGFARNVGRATTQAANRFSQEILGLSFPSELSLRPLNLRIFRIIRLELGSCFIDVQPRQFIVKFLFPHIFPVTVN